MAYKTWKSINTKMSQNFCAIRTFGNFFFSLYLWNFKQYGSTVVDKLTCRQESDEIFLVHARPNQFLHFLYFTSLYTSYHTFALFFPFLLFLYCVFIVVSFIILCLPLHHFTCSIYSFRIPVSLILSYPFLKLFSK